MAQTYPLKISYQIPGRQSTLKCGDFSPNLARRGTAATKEKDNCETRESHEKDMREGSPLFGKFCAFRRCKSSKGNKKRENNSTNRGQYGGLTCGHVITIVIT